MLSFNINNEDTTLTDKDTISLHQSNDKYVCPHKRDIITTLHSTITTTLYYHYYSPPM